MPGWTDWKLIRAAKEIVPDIKSILTGYRDFSYAQTAIHLRAIDYILKPSDPKETIEVVLKAKKQIEKERAGKLERENFLRQISCMQDIVHNAVMVRSLTRCRMTDGGGETETDADTSGDCPPYPVRNAVIRQVLDYISKRSTPIFCTIHWNR